MAEWATISVVRPSSRPAIARARTSMSTSDSPPGGR